MNESISTPDALIAAARHLFARRGFKGSSLRTITAAASANLGSVTYHFGSKDALYLAVLDEALTPFRQRLADAAVVPGKPLDRIEAVLRALFDHLAQQPDLPRLMVQQLASGEELHPVVRTTMQANIELITDLIREGQEDGTIRAGDPQLMALSVGGQPIFLALMRRALQQAVSLDQDDLETRKGIADSVVGFARAGLRAEGEWRQ